MKRSYVQQDAINAVVVAQLVIRHAQVKRWRGNSKKRIAKTAIAVSAANSVMTVVWRNALDVTLGMDERVILKPSVHVHGILS